MYAKDFAMRGELLLAFLKTFAPQINKQQTLMCLHTLDMFKSRVIQSIIL
jgi:hypothetical protein